jgi:hypothetical protein
MLRGTAGRVLSTAARALSTRAVSSGGRSTFGRASIAAGAFALAGGAYEWRRNGGGEGDGDAPLKLISPSDGVTHWLYKETSISSCFLHLVLSKLPMPAESKCVDTASAPSLPSPLRSPVRGSEEGHTDLGTRRWNRRICDTPKGMRKSHYFTLRPCD